MQRFIPKQPSMHGSPNGRIKLATLLGTTCNTDTRRKTGTIFLSTQVSYLRIKQRTSQRPLKLGNSRELLSAQLLIDTVIVHVDLHLSGVDGSPIACPSKHKHGSHETGNPHNHRPE